MVKTYALEGDRMFPREDGRWVHRSEHETLLARCETAERQLAAAERDAARYRWLRTNDCTVEYDDYWREALNSAVTPAYLDAAMDARQSGAGTAAPASQSGAFGVDAVSYDIATRRAAEALQGADFSALDSKAQGTAKSNPKGEPKSSLMPCPFCGGATMRCGDQPGEDAHTCHHILCTKCLASFDMARTVDPNNDTHETVEALEAACIEAFNRRIAATKKPDHGR